MYSTGLIPNSIALLEYHVHYGTQNKDIYLIKLKICNTYKDELQFFLLFLGTSNTTSGLKKSNIFFGKHTPYFIEIINYKNNI